MNIDQLVYAALTADPAVDALVSGRVYPLTRPQHAVYPTITYSRRGTDRETTLSGRTNLANTQMEVECHAKTYAESRDLLTAVRKAMETATTFSTVSGDDADTYEDDTETVVSSMDFSLWHDEELA